MTKTRKNKQWLRNPDQRKNPKIFSANFIQLKDGSFQILGGQTKVLTRLNQHTGVWESVDTRDFACELRNAGIRAL